jgi:acetolactate synthase-1/2/3 large subunit
LTDNSTSEHVTEPQQIRPSLERARAAGTPALVNVMIDTNVFSSGTRNQTMYK